MSDDSRLAVETGLDSGRRRHHHRLPIPMHNHCRLSPRHRIALAVCLAAVACSKDQNPLGPHLETVVFAEHAAAFTDLARFGIYATDFQVTHTGALRVTVDWTSPTNDLDLVLTNPACDTVSLAAGLCKVFARDEGNSKPATVSLATGATGYRVVVVNRGPGTESGTVNATVTETRVVQ